MRSESGIFIVEGDYGSIWLVGFLGGWIKEEKKNPYYYGLEVLHKLNIILLM